MSGARIEPGRRNYVPWLLALAIAVASFVAFIPALTAGICIYDDISVLFSVEGYRGLGPTNLRWMFTTTHAGHYQPLTWLSYAVDYQFWAMNPVGYHLSNLLVHSINASLVYVLARRLIAAGLEAKPGPAIEAGAALAAILFGVHPLRVESVAWITERRDVLSTCFLLLAAIAYLRAFPVRSVAPASRAWYWASVALLGASLLCKAWGMSFFVVLLVLDWFPLRRLSGPPWRSLAGPARAVLVQKTPYVALGVAAAVMAARAQASMPFAVTSLERWGVGARFWQACYGLLFYIEKTVCPVGLAVLREIPRRIDWTEARFVSGLVFTVAAAALIVAFRRRAPALVAAGVVYAVVLAPVLGVLQSGPQIVADRYSYVANIGWAVVLGGAAAWLVLRARRRLAPVALTSIAIAGALGALSWRQTEYWQDSAALFKHAIDVGAEGPMVREMYGNCLLEKGRKEEALTQFVAANEMDPEYSEAWYSRAVTLRGLGRQAEAEQVFLKARQIMADSWRADLMLGMMYMDQERVKEAESCFRAAIANVESPLPRRFSSRPYLMLAMALDLQGDERGARQWLNKAAQYKETRDEALGVLRAMDQEQGGK